MAVSEDAIAEAFSTQYAESLKFDHDQGRWFEWDGTRWSRHQMRLAYHYARLIGRELGNGQRQICKASVTNGAERFATADPRHAVTADWWDPDPWLLGTPGGAVDLRSGELRPASANDRITKVTSCAPAKGSPAQWMTFLSQCTGDDEELTAYLKRIVGYCLTGSTKEHALFFLYGPGGNGKSVFLNILTHVLGEYAKTAPMDAFTNDRIGGHPEELAMLRGARCVTSSETEEGRTWRESRLKGLTGGDPITARFMYRSFFTFQPECKLIFSGNHLPCLKSADPAMRRRLHILPFLHTPVEPDPDLELKLRLEAPAILAWAIEGCLEWQSHGLGECEIVAEATTEYFDAQDTFGQWLEERCIMNAEGWEQPTMLYRDWSNFAQSQGEPAGNLKAFAQTLKKTGFPSVKRGGIRGYLGLVLRPTVSANYVS
jgi:putative DNA primase/helicase